jgi:hypothetical protein
LGPGNGPSPLRFDAGDSGRCRQQRGQHEPRIPSHEVTLLTIWAIGFSVFGKNDVGQRGDGGFEVRGIVRASGYAPVKAVSCTPVATISVSSSGSPHRLVFSAAAPSGCGCGPCDGPRGSPFEKRMCA